MAIKTTRWSPDTCTCVIEYTWDNTSSLENRVHTVSNFVRTCPDHSNLPNNTAKWNVVIDENPRKNRALQDILDNGPSALYDVVNGNRQLKTNIPFIFSYSGEAPDRVLTVSFPGISLTTNQRNTIQNVLNNKFGSGKVVLA